MTMTKTYYVWRRNSPHRHLDGYVGVSAYDPNSTPNSPGESYDILLKTTDFNEAQKLTISEQAKDTRYEDD